MKLEKNIILIEEGESVRKRERETDREREKSLRRVKSSGKL